MQLRACWPSVYTFLSITGFRRRYEVTDADNVICMLFCLWCTQLFLCAFISHGYVYVAINPGCFGPLASAVVSAAI